MCNYIDWTSNLLKERASNHPILRSFTVTSCLTWSIAGVVFLLMPVSTEVCCMMYDAWLLHWVRYGRCESVRSQEENSAMRLDLVAVACWYLLFGFHCRSHVLRSVIVYRCCLPFVIFRLCEFYRVCCVGLSVCVCVEVVLVMFWSKVRGSCSNACDDRVCRGETYGTHREASQVPCLQKRSSTHTTG